MIHTEIKLFVFCFCHFFLICLQFIFCENFYRTVSSFRRPGLTIHPPPATVSIQRSQTSRDPATRITLPSHPAIGAQKPQPTHTMAQVTTYCWLPWATLNNHPMPYMCKAVFFMSVPHRSQSSALSHPWLQPLWRRSWPPTLSPPPPQ